MPCYVAPPSVTQSQWLEHMLCQACRYLSKIQLQTVSGLDCYYDLYSWYTDHLMRDFINNYDDEVEREKYQREGNRIGVCFMKEKEGVYTKMFIYKR